MMPTAKQRKQGVRIPTMGIVGACLVVLALALPVLGRGGPSEPAVHVKDILVPGHGEAITRPSALRFDPVHRELLVTDPGHDRIVIFSAEGAFKFAFGLGDSMTTPVDVATDSAGYIYVLGSSPAGRILMRFDFDGLALERIAIPAQLADKDVAVTKVACDDRGNLYGLDEKGLRILKLGPGGAEVVCDLAQQLKDNVTGVYGLGVLSWDRGEFLLPVATSGFVMRYSPEGEFLGTIGHGGAKPGALAFPVAAARTSGGDFLVLDKNRFCVVCYDESGAFLGEFGGKGFSPGWFINPSLLAVTGPETVVVGQIFSSRIQMLELPGFLHVRTSQAAVIFPAGAPVDGGGEAAKPTRAPEKRRSIDTQNCLFTCGDVTGRHNFASVSPSEASS